MEWFLLGVERVLFSRGFLRWGGVVLGGGALVAAVFLFVEASQPGMDSVSGNVGLRSATYVGMLGFALLGGGLAAWGLLPRRS